MTTLRVSLGDQTVGYLELSRNGERIFRFDESYDSLPRRPVLGQYFEDIDRTSPVLGREQLPPYFANLLPQGALRRYLAEKLQVREGQDFHLLAVLGSDLPGAVVVSPLGDMDVLAQHRRLRSGRKSRPTDPHVHYFSVAGMQLKFSMEWVNNKLTLPSKTRAGRYIVKLPDSAHPGVPECEHAVMQWASNAGIRIPEVELASLKCVELAYEELPAMRGEVALVVRRYDRTRTGRLHQEDFAQVLNVDPDDKYAESNRAQRARAQHFETIAAILAAIDPTSVREFVRRVAFMIISGNEDAHLKNWSLLYDESGVRATLSPAYDLVSTIAYTGNKHPRLPLRIASQRNMRGVRVQAFDSMARAIGDTGDVVRGWVREDSERIRDAYAQGWKQWGFPEKVRGALERHMRAVSL